MADHGIARGQHRQESVTGAGSVNVGRYESMLEAWALEAARALSDASGRPGDWDEQETFRADVDADACWRLYGRLAARFGGELPPSAVVGLGSERSIPGYWGGSRGLAAWSRGPSDDTLDLVADAIAFGDAAAVRRRHGPRATADVEGARRAAVRKARERMRRRGFP